MLRQRKSNQKEGDPGLPPFGFPRYFANKRGCATRPSRAHKTCPAAELKQCSPKSPLADEISRRRTGERNSTAVLCGHSCPHCLLVSRWALCAHLRFGGFASEFGFCFSLPCAPPSSGDQTGVVRRICLSTWTRSGSCEFMRRPVWLSNAVNPAGAVRWGRLLFGYFFFGEARKSD